VRGIAGNIGAKELAAAAATVEAAFRDVSSARSEPDLSVFATALHRVVSSIASLAEAETRSPASQPVHDLAEIVPKLAQLESLLKNDDFDARNILEELLPHFQQTAMPHSSRHSPKKSPVTLSKPPLLNFS
jgi:two-component system sensor histidine kinase/response regulator